MSSVEPIPLNPLALPNEQGKSPQQRQQAEQDNPTTLPASQPSSPTSPQGSIQEPTRPSQTRSGGSKQASDLYRLQIDAEAQGNSALADQYKSQQVQLAVLNQGLAEANGLPGSAPNETSQTVDPEIEIYRQFYAYMEKQQTLDAVLEQHDFMGIQTEFGQQVMDPYKARNAEPLLEQRPNMSPEDQIALMGQLEPTVVDPNWIADLRNRLVKLDIDMKAVDPSFSVYTNPKTARVANWLAREAGPFTPGFAVSGPQQHEDTGETMGKFRAFGEGAVGFGMNILTGAVNLSGEAIGAIAGEEYGVPWAAATNYVEDQEGNLINNGGKVPGFVSTIAAVNARILGQNVHEYLARVDQAANFEHMQQAGFEKVLRGSAGVVGMGFGFGLPAGAAMTGGQAAFAPLMNKGLMRLAASGASPRMVKLTRVLAAIPGAAVGNGLAEGLAFGRADGYGKAFVHGMAMAPVLMALGALGRKSESVLTRAKMPAFIARGVSGGLEGIGFGTLEAAQTGALWKLMQDPSESTFEIYAKNMLGFAVFKGAFGRSVANAPGFGEAAGRQITRQAGRERLAEEISRADEGELLREVDEVVATQEPVGAGELGLRDVAVRERPAEPKEGERRAVTEKSADVPRISADVPRISADVPRMAPKELAAEVQRLRAEGPSPENRARIIQLLEQQRGAVTEAAAAEVQRGVEVGLEAGERMEGQAPRERPQAERERLMQEGPTPENRKRVIQLLEQERGKLTEAASTEIQRGVEAQVKAGERLPVTRQEPAKPRTEPSAAELEAAATLEARVVESGVPREILRELGDISRARRAAKSPSEAAELYRRQLEVEMELDALEMSQDPVMNAEMREALRAREVAELDVPEGELEAVDPAFGERAGPESMRSEASPFRQQEALLKPGEEGVRASDIVETLKGRPGFPGVRILGRRLGAIKGSAVQVAIRAGRIAKRGTAGVFKIFENLTRTKEGMDLVVALHEWSHAMQRQVHIGKGGDTFSKEVRKWLKAQPTEVLEDMHKILRNYPGADKLPMWAIGAEAWAEWHARNLLGDATLRAEVPHLTRVMDAFLANQPHLRAQYLEVQEMVDVYKRQGSRLRVRESVQRGKAKKQGSVAEQIIRAGEGVWDKVVKSFFDDMHLLKKSQRRWLELSDISVDQLSILDNPARVYDAIALTSSKQAESFIRRGTHNLALERTGESLEAVMNDVGGNLKGKARNEKTIDFIDYLVSSRAIDLIGHGKKQTLPLSDYLQAKKELLAANPDFTGLSERVKRWSDSLLDLLAEAGNVPELDVQRMKDYSVVYIPFVRAMDGLATRRGGMGVAAKGGGIKTLKGDTREISDPMQAMFEVTSSMIAKAHQQMVMKSLYKMTLRADVGGLATRVERSNVPENYQLDQVFRQMRAKVMDRVEGLEGKDLESWTETFGMMDELIRDFDVGDEVVTLFGQKLLPFGEGANIIAYTPRLTGKEIDSLPKHRQAEARDQNGKMQWLEVDADAYKALMGLDQPSGPTFMDNAVMKVLFGYPKQAVRFFATDANPVFVAANAIRDIMSAPVFDSQGKIKPFSGWRKFFGGAAMLMSPDPKSKQVVDMFEASGARTASIYNEGVRRQMRGEVVGTLGKTREALQKAVGWWTNKLAQPESFIRIHEFERVHTAATKAGKSPVEAAMEALEAAKEITINFARAGALSRLYNQMTPYFSASFAGQRKMLRSLTGMEGTNDAQRKQLQTAAIANGLIGITAPAMAAWVIVHDEDWYKDLPEWRKRHFVNFKVPGSDTIASLPLPFELGTIFGSMPQILADTVTDSNPIEFWPSLAQSMFPYLRGLGSALPAGAKPLLEAASGYDFFAQREQTPFWVKRNAPPEEQVRAGTSKMAQEAFYLFNKFPGIMKLGIDNPIELEQFLSGYTAGASTSFFRWVDETAGLKDHPGMRPGAEAVYGSFLNRFARQTPHGASRAVDEFYNKLVPEVEQQDRASRTPATRRAMRDINRDRDRMSDIRRQVKSGDLTRVEGDRLIFEIATRALDR